MVLREHKDPLNTSRGIMGPLENSAGVQNNRGRLKQRFDLIRKLGQGTYGKVQLGIDKETGQEVAIKTIKKSKIETEADLIRIRREIQIMSSVRHPNIIHIYEVFENREKMVLVMEYAAGGELYDYLNERKILQEDEARRIFRQIASAAYYCHKNKICHRDLKLENILLDEKSNAKIADFGLSNVFDDVNLLKTFCGSPLYASPEIVKGTPYSGPEVDCWSLGVLLYTLVYGAMPFDGSNFKRLVKQISAGDYYEPKKPAEASGLIRRMLTVDPLKRARVDDICSHPWINFSFDKDCLQQAEELAKQTPVRLDVLLTLAPNHNINHSQVVIPGDDQMEEGASASQIGNHNHNESNTDISEPPRKLKLQNDNKATAPEKGNKSEVAPPKPKRKIQTKSKSKSTPLLDLIQDVCEEEAEGDVDMVPCAPSAPAPAPSKQPPGQDQDDDEADTLSEISEIQTIAEDLDSKSPKQRSKSDKPRVSKVVKEKAQVNEPSTSTKPKTETPKPIEVAKVEPPTPAKEVTKKLEAPEAKVQEEKSAESPKTVVKKKVIKPKPPASSTDEDEKKKDEADKPKPTPEKVTVAQEKPKAVVDKTQPVTDKKPEAIPQKSESPEAKAMTSGDSNKSDSSEKEGDGSKPKAKLVRTRSGSTSDASPTRIERRNSKVISQKTAELIQNLATKASTSPGSATNGTKDAVENRPPGIKKLVIPQFKVSDAKNKFDTKPPRPITSSIMSQSKAAFEAKAQATKEPEKKPSTVETAKVKPAEAKESIASPKPMPKEKSPSPAKKEEVVPKQEEKLKDEVPKTADIAKKSSLGPVEPQKSPAVSPKVKPKVIKKAVEEQTVPEPTPAPKVVDTVVKPVAKPEVPKAAPAKVQVPTTVQTSDQGKVQVEVKPVLIDTGKGVLKPVTMVVKSKPTSTTPIQSPPPMESEVTSSAKKVPVNEPTEASEAPEQPKPKLLTKLVPQNKEQAVKKISSVINKIVSSSSSDEGKFTPKTSKLAKQPSESTPTHKAEVSFPVVAAQSQERVIPIKFEDEGPSSPPSGLVSGAQTQSTAQQTPSGSKTSIPRFPTLQPRMDSFKRFDSMGSMYSRQDSSDNESCSLAAPKPEPIRKSPREFLIPIKIEASGQTVTPKEDVVSEGTGSEDDFRIDSRLRSGRFGKPKRYSSLLSDSSLDEEAPSASVSAAGSRRPSATPSQSSQPAHARSRSQGDEPEAPATTFKRYRIKRPDLDRSDSFSSAEEDDEDFFEVLTADSLFSNLLDRVRNLTKRLNREGSVGPNWPNPANEATSFGLWNPSSSLRDLMAGTPGETRGFTSSGPGNFTMNTHRSFSREPSASSSMMMNSGPGAWRRSLSRDVSGDSDASGSLNPQSRNLSGKPASTDIFETTSVRSLPLSLSSRRAPSYLSQRSEPADAPGSSSSSLAGSRQSLYGSSGVSGSSRPSYSRTVSNTEYGNPGISRTLPFRRSLKSYDRSCTSGIGDYSSSSYLNTNMDSMIGAVRGLGQSLIDSPATFDPDSYLRQLRSMSRDRESSIGRDSSTSRMSSISEQEPVSVIGNNNSSNPPPALGELNGWAGGSNSSCPSSILGHNGLGGGQGQPLSPSESGDNSNEDQGTEGVLSIHDKMNNYQNYYQSLSQSPLRRFQLASPSQIHGTNTNSASVTPNSPKPVPGIGLARLRPNTMYETSFIDNQPQPHTNPNVSPSQSQPVNQLETNVNSLAQKPISNAATQSAQLANSHERPSPTLNTNLTRATPTREVPINTPQPQASTLLEDRRPSLTSSATSIPKWGVSIHQYRPLSISSFSDGQRASSVSRLMSPPPRDDPVVVGKPSPPLSHGQGSQSPVTTIPVPATSPKKKEVRATSVERITRFLERKSVPREMTPGPPEPKLEKTSTAKDLSDNVQNSGRISPEKSGSKTSKPSFLQSLEKKWERLTTSGKPVTSLEVNNLLDDAASTVSKSNTYDIVNGPPPTAPTPEPSEDNSLGDEDTKISESVLLRRAVSPEKKLKKFGSGTVNFMLGKFKKFEEPPAPTISPSGSSGSKIPSGKPPLGIPSRIGRRVQSVYAGAASDSALTLPPQQHVVNPRVIQISPLTRVDSQSKVEPLTNGHKLDEALPEPDADMIRAAEIAQQKRRSVRIDTRASSPAPQVQPAQIPNSSSPIPQESKRPQRPYSLGVFSPPCSTSPSETQKPQSFIPRPSLGGTTMRSFQNPESLSPPPVTSNPEPITAKSMSPPQITIHDVTCGNGDADNHSPISPTSISDSFDSNSVCSDKNDPKNLSILDEEESVSDRILRKSFYSRFNSIDRARRCSSLSSAGAARRNLGPLTTPKNGYGKSSSSSSGSVGHSNSLNTRAQSVERSLPKPNKETLSPRRAFSPGPGTSDSYKGSINGSSLSRPKSPSPHNLVINKYNPNPLFKELITDDYRSNVEKKTEYSRRVTSKLSKLLREIESDLNTCTLSKRDDDEDNCNSNGIGIGLSSLSNNHNHNYNNHKSNDVLNRRNHIFSREVSVQPDEVSRLSPDEPKDDSNDSMNER